ncbi:MerR family transcriptional regulator [Microbacterium sp. Yaish 1]|uniref:MerR family transcriptional regulator n=1 Tax=Microbacterium sp. Yaish 1 TaxID=2025014 RepID=UPI000B940364|nr:MerR family transcriptional regulator [Microbacterium sp. Yaish 1]OYC97774.1 MerR family transcriptional regulator [Microbacterium sp. Yaish 1]
MSNRDEVTMRIGEVTERTEMSFRTLRHYDEIGLVTPSARTEGGFRLYTEDDVARILLIRRMKPLGYSLDEMRELLDVVDALAASPADTELRARLETIRAGATERREKLTRQVAMADEFLAQLGDI